MHLVQLVNKFEVTMNQNNFTVNQLKACLRKLNHPSAGSKAELLNRLNSADPEGLWMTFEKVTDDEAEETGAMAIAEGQRREIEYFRRERDLMQREIDLMRRENDLLRNSPRSVQTENSGLHLSIKAVSDLLSDFDGCHGSFSVWEKSLKLLRNSYSLDENFLRILIGTKLKGKELEWLYSRTEHIEMNTEELLRTMGKIFDHRTNRITLRKEFEERSWKSTESFSEYHHDKMILAGQVGVHEEEMVDYMIDGISDITLRNQARMHRFSTPSDLLDAFEQITLSPRRNVVKKRNPVTAFGRVSVSNDSGVQRRCYNC